MRAASDNTDSPTGRFAAGDAPYRTAPIALVAFVVILAVPHAARAGHLGSVSGPVQLALKSSLGKPFSFFPHAPGRESCMIPRGGPPPGGHSVAGTCATQVVAQKDRSNQYVVTFTEWWAWRSFHYQGAPRRRQHHFWRLIVRASGRVAFGGQGGDFPPQFVH